MHGLLAFTSNFSSVDWAIVAAYLLGSVVIGFYANRYVSNMTDYVVAGRALRSRLAIATMIGSELGLVTVMYSAQKGFTGGFAAFHIGLVAGFVTLLVGLSGFLVAPLREMGVMTIPEFYERRFGRGVRVLGGVMLALGGILNMGLFLKAGSLFIAGLIGMTSAFELKIVMTVLLALVLLYTILGGMVSVVVTDYVQFVVLAIGMLAAVLIALRELPWNTLVETVAAERGAAAFDPLHGEGFGPAYVVWMMFVAGLVSCAVWPTAVMRACSAESVTVVRRLYVWSSIGFLIRSMLPQFLGICAFVYMVQHADLGAPYIASEASGDQTLMAMPVFLSQVLPVGLMGLIAAGMLAAFMSTHDSYLLCWSTVITQDIVAPLMGQRLSNTSRILLTRVLIAAIGLFLLVWGLWYPLKQDMWDYMAVTGSIYFTGAFALLLFGIYWRRASTAGAYLALLAGFTSVFGLGAVQRGLQLDALAERLHVPLHGHYVGLASAGLCLLAMVVGSRLWPDRRPAVALDEQKVSS
ncbi:MAG: sodium:solute symporter family protein [Planctomycetota bacterium]|nr:MAG: sodium:solute symporter family protein [Planctomycetota bacterium]